MDIQNLELQTDIYKILDRLFLELKNRRSDLFSLGYKESGDYLMVQCPYHKFGQEKHPSAEFRKADGFFYCFNCKASHPLPSVISDLLDTNGRAWLLENFDGVDTSNREINNFDLPERKAEEKVYIDPKELDKYRTKHAYMYQRKMTDEIIEKFDIGYDEETECITFPVKDENGNILFIARRSVKTKYFHYPNNVDKPLYGLYEIYREMKNGKKIDTIYVCESMINALTLWSWGYYAIALNGTGSHKQMEMLRKTPFKELILALDPDFAGRKGTAKIKAALEHDKILSEVDIPEGKDVNDFEKDEFLSLNVKDDFWI